MYAAGGYSIEITKILIDHPGIELNLTNKVRCVLSTYCTNADRHPANDWILLFVDAN